jgi:outer membrane protein insertion porin family
MKEVTYLENEEVSDELTEDIAGRIKDLYINEGYYYAQVAAGIETEDNLITAKFIIFEGDPVILRSVVLKGVSIKEEAVKEVLLLPENKPFNANRVKSSRDELIRFYQALGYLDVEVTEVKKIFSSDGKEVDIEFHVLEGPQIRIEELNIAGNKAIHINKIRRAIKMNKGDPYNRINVGDARYRVHSLYGDNGYMDASVQVDSIVKEDRVYVTFRVEEGEPSVVGKIIISGNNKTKTKIVKREITLEEGEYYDSNEVTKTKQNLYKLGLFNEVSVTMLQPVQTPDGRTVRDMLVSLKEGNAGSVEFSFGYADYEEFRGGFAVSYNNIGGYNRQAGFRTELSSVEKKYVLNFKEPWLFNKPDIPLKIFLIKEDTRAVDIDTREVFYKIEKLSFIAGVAKELMKGLKVGFNYEYSFTDTTDVQPGVILSKEDVGTLEIGSLSTSLFYDRRDNPFDPTTGSIHGITVKFASAVFLSQVDFVKGSFKSAWFFPVHKRIVFAFSVRGGMAYNFEDGEELPLIERFFLGGRNSVRGYKHDFLGPKGVDDTPTGGNVFAAFNNEFRIDVGKGFGLVTFVDAGNVWLTIDTVSSELKYTTGLGLRYKTPVGPVRLDYGYKLDREEDESVGEVHFSFGHVF